MTILIKSDDVSRYAEFTISNILSNHVCFSNAHYTRTKKTLKICRVDLCTELFYAIVPTLFLCSLQICYP